MMMGLLFAGLLWTQTASAQGPSTKLKIGDNAPEIALPTPDGDTLTLSKVNRRAYVIVDFWASWCGPCRRANPVLVEMMKSLEGVKFKDARNGIKVFSVSLDRNADAWVKGIEKDELYWKEHVSDLKHWSSDAAAEYGVRSIPQVFLISPEGKVLANYNNIYQLKKEIEKLVEESALEGKKKTKRKTKKYKDTKEQ